MTDPQHRAIAHALQGAGLGIAIPFMIAELTGRPSPLPPIAMLFAILSFMAAWVFDGLSRP